MRFSATAAYSGGGNCNGMQVLHNNAWRSRALRSSRSNNARPGESGASVNRNVVSQPCVYFRGNATLFGESRNSRALASIFKIKEQKGAKHIYAASRYPIYFHARLLIN